MRRIGKTEMDRWLVGGRMENGRLFSGGLWTEDRSTTATPPRSIRARGQWSSGRSPWSGGNGLEELYVQLTRQKEGARIVMIEDMLDRTTNETGIDLIPTEKMVRYAQDLSQKYDADLPKVAKTDFEVCRDFLNKWSNHRIEDEGIDFSLEKVESMIGSLSRCREKANVLDYDIEKTSEIEKEWDSVTTGIGTESDTVSSNEMERARSGAWRTPAPWLGETVGASALAGLWNLGPREVPQESLLCHFQSRFEPVPRDFIALALFMHVNEPKPGVP